jgi:hypothetical protein
MISESHLVIQLLSLMGIMVEKCDLRIIEKLSIVVCPVNLRDLELAVVGHPSFGDVFSKWGWKFGVGCYSHHQND